MDYSSLWVIMLLEDIVNMTTDGGRPDQLRCYDEIVIMFVFSMVSTVLHVQTVLQDIVIVTQAT